MLKINYVKGKAPSTYFLRGKSVKYSAVTTTKITSEIYVKVVCAYCNYYAYAYDPNTVLFLRHTSEFTLQGNVQ
jgi:hypothetical protein